VVVVDGDGDGRRVAGLVRLIVELRHVGVRQRLLRRDALVRVELQQLADLRTGSKRCRTAWVCHEVLWPTGGIAVLSRSRGAVASTVLVAQDAAFLWRW
jgi:hypothetical protein